MISLDMHTVERLLVCLLSIPLLIYTGNQVRKPTRWVGRGFLWLMNISHSNLTDWGLKHVRVEERFTILDIGCGGGRTVGKLAALASQGMVYGVNYADGSVAASRAKNVQLIKAGRVEIRQAPVSQLPFPDDTFDLVTAVETQYYWPDLVKDMQEVLRVLKPGGRLMVIAESYKRGAYNKLQRPVMKLLRSSNLDVDGHHGLFSAAGYINIEIFEEGKKGWLCGIGRKPS